MPDVTAVQLLVFNATLQVFVSVILGFLLLIPMQPWGKEFLKRVKNQRDLVSTHLDWFMLAFLQYGIAFALTVMPTENAWPPAILLAFGGWVNPLPYLFRGVWGINAFSLSGTKKQILAASLGLISVLSIFTALTMLLADWFFPGSSAN